MGRVAFTIAGAVIGAYFGNPALGAAIGGAIGGAIFDEDTNVIVEGPKLQDLNVASSAYGAPIPWVFGTQRVGSQMIWATDIIEVREEETADAGGAKGGPSSSQTNVTYKYQGNAAMLFCRGPKDILQLWADGKLVYDTTGQGQLASAKFTNLIETYSGTTDQEPDPTIQADVGIDDTPAYRDFCYVVMHDFPLEDFGNRLPQWNALVSDATEEFPFDDLDVSGLTPTGGSIINLGVRTNDDRFLILGDSGTGVLMLDLLTQQIVEFHESFSGNIGISIAFSGRYMIDSAGNLIVVSEAGNTDFGVFIFSVPELEVLAWWKPITGTERYRQYAISPATGEPIPGFDPSDRIACMGPGGKVDVWPSSVLGANTFNTTSTGVEIPSLEIPIYSIELTDFISASSPATGFNNLVDGGSNVDRDGIIWFSIVDNQGQTSRDMYLVEFDPWAGAFLSSRLVPQNDVINGWQRGELLYDPISHRLAIHVRDIATTDQIITFDIDTDLFLEEQIDIVFFSSEAHNESWNGRWAVNQSHYWQDFSTGINRRRYDFDTHSISDQIPLTSLTPGETWDITFTNTRGTMFSPLNNALIVQQSGIDTLFWLYFDRLSGNSTTLKAVVDEISSEVGLDLTKLDTDALAEFIVRGYAVNRRMSARSALEPLRKSYFFDATESDYLMRFVIRGAEPVLTLTDDDLGVSNELEESVPLVIETRRQEVELPLRIDFQYSNPDFEYQQGSQYAKRADEAVITLNQIRLDTAIVFTDDEAKDIAERQLFTPWVERDVKRASTTWQHLALDPTDVILIALESGLSFRVYVLEIDTSIEGVIEISGVLQDPEVATPRGTVTGQDAEGFDPTQLVVASGSTIHIMDIPLLQDADDQVVPVLHSAAGRIGQSDPGNNPLEWLGARIDRSFDSITYAEWTFHRSDTEASHGSVVTALPSTTAPWVWDRTNVINVRMRFGTLTSITETQVLDSQLNTALLGKEIIQFANAVLQDDGSYNLDTLLRARRGTDLYARANNGIAHSANERFVILTEPTINIKSHAVDNLGRAQFFRAVTVGSPGLDNKQLTPVGQSKFPYAPYLVSGVRDGGGEVIVSWSRRTRVGGAIDWIAGPSEPPISEDTETYQIAVIDENGVEVGSHSVTDATTFTYTVALSNIDFGTDLDPVTQTVDFIIYQISGTIGRGFPSETLTA